MVSQAPLVLDHVLNPGHDALAHSVVFSASEGSLFCLHCASERYESAPNFRKLALLESISCILRSHGPRCLRNGIGACVAMLLHGMDSTETRVVQAATDILLALKDELPDPVGVLASLVSRTVSLGLPRASGHLFTVGQLLANASHDPALSGFLADACTNGGDAANAGNCRRSGDRTSAGGAGDAFRGFASFLAAHAVSVSCADDIRSDVIYVAMEVLDCCTAAAVGVRGHGQADPGYAGHSSPSSLGDDPFVCVMLAIPRLLSRRSSCDEPLQLHSVAYLATAMSYCRQRMDAGVPGWLANAAGVPEVLVALFDGNNGGEKEIGPRGSMVGGVVVGVGARGASLCDTLKALLMASTYRVRSATARLIASFCNDDSSRVHEDPSHKSAVSTNRFGCFIRDKLIAAGTTDFLFDTIKTEQAGTLRHYLEAIEALASSPVEFFHAGNFSMKFAAPILLGASRGQVGMTNIQQEDGGVYRGSEIQAGGGRSGWEDDEVRTVVEELCRFLTSSRCKAIVFTLSSRLLLQALVAVPPVSSAGVVEELLATAAVSSQSETGRCRAIGVAADVLSLIASGDLSLSKDRRNFIDAVKTVLDHLGEALLCSARSESQAVRTVSAESSTLGPSDQLKVGPPNQDRQGDGLVLQAARVMESLLFMADEWVLAQDYPGSCEEPRRFKSGAVGGYDLREEGRILAEIVFSAYGRTLTYQHELVARSDKLTHGIAFVSCVGAAIDAASAVLHKQCGEAANKAATLARVRVKPFFLRARGLMDFMQVNHSCPGRQNGTEYLADDGSGTWGCLGDWAVEGERVALTDPTDKSAASCLETIFETTVNADMLSWLLNLYTRCRGTTTGRVDGRHGGGSCGARRMAAEGAARSLQQSDDNNTHCDSPSELLAEVIQSLLYAQGWINGLCTHGVDRPVHARQGPVGSREDAGRVSIMRDGMESTFSETARFVLESWTASRGKSIPLDQHVLSLLGTSADNGQLCKLAVLLISLSPSYLGVLHPHPGCRVDSAVTVLRYVKAVPEAVFCLNMFSHAILSCADGGGGGASATPRLDSKLMAAVEGVLARFPIADLAFSTIPLSATAVSFALRAKCMSFVGDWIVAAPLARIKRVLSELGLPPGWAPTDNVSGTGMDGRKEYSAVNGNHQYVDSVGFYDQAALIGILDATVNRWRPEVGDGLQHCRGEVTIYRLSSILQLSPDEFCRLALDSDLQHDKPWVSERDAANTIESALVAIIPQTLDCLSIAMSSVVLRRSSGGSNNRSSKLACADQVLQLASAFLRARCIRGYYSSSAESNRNPSFGRRVSHHLSLEVALASACGRLLQVSLDPRSGHGSNGTSDGVIDREPSTSSALSAVLNLLGALLVLCGGDSDLILDSGNELWLALQQPHAALSEVLVSPILVKMLQGWLECAPETLAAFFQVCTLWNAVATRKGDTNNNVGRNQRRLDPPFEVLGEVLSLRNNGPYHIDRGASTTRRPEHQSSRTRGVRRSLLQVLAARCVKSAACSRPFSPQQVLTLQIGLQGIACDSGVALASAALEAIHSLWEAYMGVLDPSDLVAQSWNSFVLECCLENAMRQMVRTNAATAKQQAEDTRKSVRKGEYLRLEEDHDEFRIDASVLMTTIGRVLLWTAGREYPRLRSAVVSGSSNIEVLSTTAAMGVYECVILLAEALHSGWDAGTRQELAESDHVDQDAREEVQPCGGLIDKGGDISVTVQRLEALLELVSVLMRIELPSERSIYDEELEVRQELVIALARLRPSIPASLPDRSGSHRQLGAGGSQQQVQRPLSGGAYHDCGGRCAAAICGGVFFVKHDNWHALSSPSSFTRPRLSRSAMSPQRLGEIVVQVERLIERLSNGLAGSGVDQRQDQSNSGEQNDVDASTRMAVDAST